MRFLCRSFFIVSIALFAFSSAGIKRSYASDGESEKSEAQHKGNTSPEREEGKISSKHEKKRERRQSPSQQKKRSKTSTTSSSIIAEPVVHHSGNPFRFRVGFEFQLASKLFPHYKDNKWFQKKPLFSVSLTNSNKHLWHAEIDGENIEFVTKPFAYNEKEDLELCLNSITSAFNVLRQLVITNHQDEKIFIHAWATEINKLLESNQQFKITINWNFHHTQFDNLFFICPAHPQNDWRVLFQPQTTLQYPLEYTIPVSFGLFGFGNDTKWEVDSFLGCLPFLDSVKEKLMKDDQENHLNILKNKMSGLLFLHASTMASMAFSSELLEIFTEKHGGLKKEDDENAYLLFAISEKLKESGQFDPKEKMTLMSRRPFSSMFNNIKAEKSFEGTYSECFIKSIQNENSDFTDLFKVPTLFFKTNYAEQFFNEDGNPKNLSHLSQKLKQEIYHKNKQTIDELLEKGVVSTTMIRNFIDYSGFFNDFYKYAIASVDNPQEVPTFRLRLTPDAPNQSPIEEMHSQYDALSPPWFLDKTNAMGAFTEDAKYDIKEYGEAIVEYRAISGVGSFFKSKTNLVNVRKNRFLTEPRHFAIQGIGLFDFLSQFNNFAGEIDQEIARKIMGTLQ